VYLAITIDVEPDCTPTWHYSNPLTFEGVSVGIRERLQPLFNRYGFPPTYLLNNVVLDDEASVEVLRRLEGEHELGTHLHAEFIAPQKQFDACAGVKAEGNQNALAPEVEREKMRAITALFADRFGRPPRCFRAGRFSAGPHTLRCLAELGYLVDTSVTPGIRWNDPSRPVPADYSRAPRQPYFVDEHTWPGPAPSGNILEVPLITYRRRFRLSGPRERWLRPVHSTLEQMQAMAAGILRKYRKNPHVVLNMMFHNVEVIPGCSPYSRSETEAGNYLSTVEAFLVYCKRLGVQGISLSGLHNVYTRHG
jgi:hypothetical protein